MKQQPEVKAPTAQVTAEVMEDAAFTAEEFASACGVAPDWVRERVEAGVLQVDTQSGAWRFDSFSLVRARRIVHLEVTYDADPQLAALTADLIEEVTQLRKQLKALGGRQGS
ncbi:chaperone modulator CbpM [soil metagenome]